MSNPSSLLTAAAVDEVFGDGGAVRPSAASLPAGVTHRATREFLTRVGLPAELRGRAAVVHRPDDPGWTPLPALREEIGKHGWAWTMPERPEHRFCIGTIFGLGLLTLNGENGQIWFISESEGGLTLLHKNVESLAYYMYAIERNAKKYSASYAMSIDEKPDDPREEFDVYMEGARALAVELHTIDPAPFAHGPGEPWGDDGEGPWAWMIREMSEGAWAEWPRKEM
ncbi:SUKH-4 family immunity protein [Actinomadura sediminis]|uniref:SUKH-4 family immunity protein n=1 Tax=Actinomadura sediminis TaxID=1038904 RepID=A0ABW3EVV1_9ACTN